MNKPAALAASNPIHGLAFPSPSFVSAAYVTAAAVKAPASIFPSSAILITPDRSENIPPSAASTSGVATLSGDKQNDNALQDLHDVFCYVFRKAVNINSTMLQNRKEQCREDYTDGMIT